MARLVLASIAGFEHTDLLILHDRWLAELGRGAVMRAPRALRSRSRIVDSDGSVLGQLADEQGVLTAEAVVDPARKRYNARSSFNGWRQPGDWAAARPHPARSEPA